MNFINDVLHLKTKEYKCKVDFANHIVSRYEISQANIDKIKVFLVRPKVKLESTNTLKKHFALLRKKENIPVVLVLDNISSRERESYIKANIPFIVRGKQCYLPFIGTLLSSRCDAEIEPLEKFMPSSQKVLFYLIYSGKKRISMQDIVTNLDFSAMTITRALKELEKAKLIKTELSGVEKIINLEYRPKELFQKSKGFLTNPIKRTQYVSKKDLPEDSVIAGVTALAEFSMLSPKLPECFASKDSKELREKKDEILLDENEQVELQVWKYSPCLFEKMKTDPLSILLTYENNQDERVEEAFEEVLSTFL